MYYQLSSPCLPNVSGIHFLHFLHYLCHAGQGHAHLPPRLLPALLLAPYSEQFFKMSLCYHHCLKPCLMAVVCSVNAKSIACVSKLSVVQSLSLSDSRSNPYSVLHPHESSSSCCSMIVRCAVLPS